MAVQNVLFPNGSNFSLSELLKIIQEAGIEPLWAEIEDGLEAVIKHEDADWGQEIRYALTVDAGGGAFGRIAQQGGRFLPGDKTRNILGKIYPKYMTMTYQFERFHQKLSKSQQQAYIENAKQEFMQKNAFQKSNMIVMGMGDGTGRQGTPVGLGAADAASGATLSLDAVDSPLKVKLSASSAAAGSSAWFLEGSVVSFVYVDRDLNDDGTDEVTAANGRVRLLALQFDDAGAGTAVKYDAFRVVKINQETDELYVLPARIATTVPTTDDGAWVQTSEWVSGGTGAVTVTPFRGRSADKLAAATDTVFDAQINDLNLIFGGETAHYVSLIHPHNVNQSQPFAKLQLGIGWTSTTEISTISDGVMTGLETLVMNQSNTVHNINRKNVLQYLATYKDNGSRELTFNSLYSFIAQHHNRNRKSQTDWSILSMNPITEASMIGLSELDRRIVEGKGIRGEDGARMIRMGGKNYQFESHSTMRRDRIFVLAKDALTLYDGKLENVEVGGQKEFLQIQDNARVNVNEAYATITGEMCVKGLRRCGAIHNFKANIL